MRNDHAFCPLDTSCEKYTGITVFLVVCGFPKCREGEVPRTYFTTHRLQNKQLLSLKQLHLKIVYTRISRYHTDRKLRPEEMNECKKNKKLCTFCMKMLHGPFVVVRIC